MSSCGKPTSHSYTEFLRETRLNMVLIECARTLIILCIDVVFGWSTRFVH